MTKEQEKQFFDAFARLVTAQNELRELRELTKLKRQEVASIEQEMRELGGAE